MGLEKLFLPKKIRQSLHFSKQPHPVIISFVWGALMDDFGELFAAARFQLLFIVADMPMRKWKSSVERPKITATGLDNGGMMDGVGEFIWKVGMKSQSGRSCLVGGWYFVFNGSCWCRKLSNYPFFRKWLPLEDRMSNGAPKLEIKFWRLLQQFLWSSFSQSRFWVFWVWLPISSSLTFWKHGSTPKWIKRRGWMPQGQSGQKKYRLLFWDFFVFVLKTLYMY